MYFAQPLWAFAATALTLMVPELGELDQAWEGSRHYRILPPFGLAGQQRHSMATPKHIASHKTNTSPYRRHRRLHKNL